MKIMLNGRYIIFLGENIMKIKCFSGVEILNEMVKGIIIFYIRLVWISNLII